MSESPRHPNPGLNGYQQDVTQAEVGALSLLVASQTSAIFRCLLAHEQDLWRSLHHLVHFWWCSARKHKHRPGPCGKVSTSWRVLGFAKFGQPTVFFTQSISLVLFHLQFPQPHLNDLNFTSPRRCLQRSYLPRLNFQRCHDTLYENALHLLYSLIVDIIA